MRQLHHLPLAKSYVNRLLVMAQLAGVYPEAVALLAELSPTEDLPDDICLMQEALLALQPDTVTPKRIVHVGEAGSVLRFFTALAAFTTRSPLQVEGVVRLKERPLAPLLSRLQRMGACFEGKWQPHNEQEPFCILPPQTWQVPPLDLELFALSSQFASALLLTAPYYPTTLHLPNPYTHTELPSRPYLLLTLQLMQKAGAVMEQEGDTLHIIPSGYTPDSVLDLITHSEYDWSAASYAYAWCALARQPLYIPHLRATDAQGDKAIAELMLPLGVKTEFHPQGGVTLQPDLPQQSQAPWVYDLKAYPDLIPTLVVTALMQGRPFVFYGTESLRLKESDRTAILVENACRLGYILETTAGSIAWYGELTNCSLQASIIIETAGDHRMAMAWSLASLHYPHLTYSHRGVVSKSYPGFWRESLFSQA